MKFSIAIYSPPTPGGNAERALRFSQSVLTAGHQIYRLFFFNDGVFNCADSAEPLCRHWQTFIKNNGIDAITCVASAHKRGLGNQQDSASKVHGVFGIGGVAQLVDASVHSDRVISFVGE